MNLLLGVWAGIHDRLCGHQHPDQNSLVIHAYGEKLAIDGGYYDWWGSPHFDTYSMSTLAHNTLLVDGTSQAVRKPNADGRITTYFDSPGYGYSVGDASRPEIYDGKLSRLDRRVLFIKPGFVVVPQEDFLVAMQIRRLVEPAESEAMIEPIEATGAHGLRIQ